MDEKKAKDLMDICGFALLILISIGLLALGAGAIQAMITCPNELVKTGAGLIGASVGIFLLIKLYLRLTQSPKIKA